MGRMETGARKRQGKIMKIALFILLIAGSAEAQAIVRGGQPVKTGPVSTKDKVEYRLHDMSLDVARQTPIRLRVDNPTMNRYYSSIFNPSCVRQGSFNLCEAFLPEGTVNQLNVPGKHQLFLFTFNGYYGESKPSEPWTLVTPKGK